MKKCPECESDMQEVPGQGLICGTCDCILPEKKAKQCPIRPDHICPTKDCGWWDDDEEMCAVITIARGLETTYYSLAEISGNIESLEASVDGVSSRIEGVEGAIRSKSF